VFPACRLAASAESFAQAVVELLSLSPVERRRMAARARLTALAWPLRLAPLMELVESAAGAQCCTVASDWATLAARLPSSHDRADRISVPAR
jgi:hypothetical protein